MTRCKWCETSDKMIKYHDTEWGTPLHNDRRQFEFLTLEVMQCGLNWNMMIEKREIFSKCFDNFDFNKIAEYTPSDIERILEYPGMIRSRPKIDAVINNARIFISLIDQWGSFSAYIWHFTNNKTVIYNRNDNALPSMNSLSVTVSRDMKKKGFKFIGPVTIYSHLQACGIINDHSKDCFRYNEIINTHPCIFLDE